MTVVFINVQSANFLFFQHFFSSSSNSLFSTKGKAKGRQRGCLSASRPGGHPCTFSGEGVGVLWQRQQRPLAFSCVFFATLQCYVHVCEGTQLYSLLRKFQLLFTHVVYISGRLRCGHLLKVSNGNERKATQVALLSVARPSWNCKTERISSTLWKQRPKQILDSFPLSLLWDENPCWEETNTYQTRGKHPSKYPLLSAPKPTPTTITPDTRLLPGSNDPNDPSWES